MGVLKPGLAMKIVEECPRNIRVYTDVFLRFIGAVSVVIFLFTFGLKSTNATMAPGGPSCENAI